MINRIVSGGQTGVDRAGLDVALELGIEHGGWCPQGRLAEDGMVPEVYQLNETFEKDYAARTEKNVIESDGTLIFYRAPISGGTQLTESFAKKHGRPCLLVEVDEPVGFGVFFEWQKENCVFTLNVAGPRESSHPDIYVISRELLGNWLRELAQY